MLLMVRILLGKHYKNIKQISPENILLAFKCGIKLDSKKTLGMNTVAKAGSFKDLRYPKRDLGLLLNRY